MEIIMVATLKNWDNIIDVDLKLSKNTNGLSPVNSHGIRKGYKCNLKNWKRQKTELTSRFD